MTKATKMWIAYDERAPLEGTDEAAVLSTVSNGDSPNMDDDRARKELRKDLAGVVGEVYVYDILTNGQLVNEKFLFSI